MDVIESISETRRICRGLPRPLGLVPTMGFLHEGHLSLVHQARRDNASVVVSIFVNPTQFGPTEDLATYPRDLERDYRLLDEANVDLAFVPGQEEMYPARFGSFVDVGSIAAPLEGKARPVHFRGVATVVAKLFNIIQPDNGYFGQKDAQQVAVIRRLVGDLNFPIDLRVMPTVRQPDGLALSSRNVHLKADERRAATALSRALKGAEQAYTQGEHDAERLRASMRTVLDGEPLLRPDYISVADSESLAELEGIIVQPALASLAVRVGAVRLIDNVQLG